MDEQANVIGEIEQRVEPFYVSFAEAAELLGIDKRAVYQAVDAGLLKPYEVMGKKALRRLDVLRHKVRPNKRRKSPATAEELWAEQNDQEQTFMMQVRDCDGCGRFVLLGTMEYRKVSVRIPKPHSSGGLTIRLDDMCMFCTDCQQPEKWLAINEQIQEKVIQAYESGELHIDL